MCKPTRTIRKRIFHLSIWNPDHPRPIPVLSSSRTQSNMFHHQPSNILHLRQLLEITPTTTNYSSPGCKLGSWNARGVSNKSATIQDYIISESLDIFTIVETFHESPDSPGLIASTPPNYKYMEKARPIPTNTLKLSGPLGGGICIMYRNHFQATIKDSGNYKTFENLASYVTFRDVHILIIAVYRPGSESIPSAFFDEFTELILFTSNFTCQILILGDINIHLDKSDDRNVKRLNRLLSAHGLKQLVIGSTHRHGHTLDVIITRSSDSLVSNIVISPPSYSDHSLISFNIRHHGPPIIRQTTFHRSYKNFDCTAFESDLRNSDIYKLTLATATTNIEANQLFSLYDTTMGRLLDLHAPLRKITIRKDSNCPWFDGDCSASKKLTRKLERIHLKTPSDTTKEERWRSQIRTQRRLFQQKRCSYYRRSIDEAMGDGKTLWKSLHSLLSPPNDSSSSCVTSDKLLDFFVEKTADIRESTKDAPPPDLSDLPPPVHTFVAFDEIATADVEKLLADSSTKQCELDSAPVWLLKKLSCVFAPMLTLLINVSLSQSTLPDKHKQAIIRPRIKKPGLDQSDPANYRPISNLSFISKLVERVVHRQLSNFIEAHNLLPLTQSGFRRFHSTETAVLKVYNDIVSALDLGFIAVLLLLDFSSAFDCVDHTILLQILQSQFGISASALLWIASFLTSRTHNVCFGAKFSKTAHLLFGVPQGSILGPLLFILYTSNITKIALRYDISIHIYADDTQLYIKLSTTNIENSKTRLTACFHEIQMWCASMRLKLNTSKTELIWFDRRSGSHPDLNTLSLQLDKTCSIRPSTVVRDLGVLLDSKLSMSNHVNSVAKACFFHLRRIRQIKRCLNEHCLQILVHSLVLSRIDYCNSVLYGLPKSTLSPLTSVIHTAARLVKNLGPRDHITDSLRQLHWLPIQARISFKICLLMFKVMSGSAPLYLSSLVTPCTALDSRRGLRSSSKGDFLVRRTNLQFGNRMFEVAGPAEWNSLPEQIRRSASINTFKTKLKTHLFSKYYD